MELKSLKIAGIDYGSKLAGTTVIAYLNGDSSVEFVASQKNQDADQMILEWALRFQPQFIFLDAPLSLPGVYQKRDGCNDYFYRAADRAVQAMSPLFLGGLTARAMKLQADLQANNMTVVEVYPGYLAKILNLDKSLYKKDKIHLATLLPVLLKNFHKFINPSFTTSIVPNWHHFDALLALLSGLRFLQNQHLTFGEPEEGLIIV